MARGCVNKLERHESAIGLLGKSNKKAPLPGRNRRNHSHTRGSHSATRLTLGHDPDKVFWLCVLPSQEVCPCHFSFFFEEDSLCLRCPHNDVYSFPHIRNPDQFSVRMTSCPSFRQKPLKVEMSDNARFANGEVPGTRSKTALDQGI